MQALQCRTTQGRITMTDSEKQRQLTRDFYVAMTYFKLPLEVRKVALESARMHWRRASRCYRAIVNSLPIRNVP